MIQPSNSPRSRKPSVVIYSTMNAPPKSPVNSSSPVKQFTHKSLSSAKKSLALWQHPKALLHRLLAVRLAANANLFHFLPKAGLDMPDPL
jgi:hypothetical protein